MEFHQYQQAAQKTVQPTPPGIDPALVPLLGLAGEAGSVVSAYKKGLRDAPAGRLTKAELREELGDLLWYMAVAASQWGLDLEDIAAANLTKISDRWRPTPADLIPFDEGYPPTEQLPRHADFMFTLEQDSKGRTVLVLRRDGHRVGDPLTDRVPHPRQLPLPRHLPPRICRCPRLVTSNACPARLQTTQPTRNRRGRRRRASYRDRRRSLSARVRLRRASQLPRRGAAPRPRTSQHDRQHGRSS